MRVLWFEVSIPARFKSKDFPNGGWQDSLEDIVRTDSRVELGIAFEGINNEEKIVDGVHYFSLHAEMSFIDSVKSKVSWKPLTTKMISMALQTIKKFNPDVIHIFGTEWYWPQIVKYTEIPVVAHIQGSMPPYLNAWLPPRYSYLDEIAFVGLNLRQQIKIRNTRKKLHSRMLMEEDNLRSVNYFMGRTEWDKKIVKLYNPRAKYYYCSEALRGNFISSNTTWQPKQNNKFIILTTGCSVLLKGLDTILRTAHILKEHHFNFEWRIAGMMSNKKFVEYKEKLKFEDENISLLGFVDKETLLNELLNSNVFVLPSYCDNSPNSICEAQYIGVPVISTFVGGIPSLVENNVNGILIPANSPHELAQTIIELSSNIQKQKELSDEAIKCAKERHNPIQILNDLLNCYESILNG